MSWKEFFKPTIAKLVIFIIVLFLSTVFLYNFMFPPKYWPISQYFGFPIPLFKISCGDLPPCGDLHQVIYATAFEYVRAIIVDLIAAYALFLLIMLLFRIVLRLSMHLFGKLRKDAQ